MSIWKSPIFYIGLLLIAVLAIALLAPFIVNWNGYRDHLESYGRQLTGRDVAINGPISVRLFPWPRLVTEDVNIANPKGFSGDPTLNARSITAELTLSGLFAGEIRVDSITLDHPVFNLMRDADGAGNWNIVPDRVLRDSKLLDQVKLEHITVIGGEVKLQDKVHGYGTRVGAVNAVLSASVLEGPWQAQGTANAGGVPFDFNFSSNVWHSDAPFKFGMKLTPQDGALAALAFEGEVLRGEVSGKLNLQPVITEDGRQSLEGSFKPLQMQADIKANFETVALDKIHIVPADAKDSGTLIEGAASLALQNGVKAQVNLNAPRLDLDSLVGSQSLRVWRAGGAMAVLNSFIKEFPAQLDLKATLDVAALSAAGEVLENVKLDASAQQDAIRIQDFTANLPGRSRMKFDGIVFPGDTAAEMGGTLAFESNDTRQFVEWLWPEAKAQVLKLWTGNRGRMKAQSDVTWSGKRFGFQNLKYELDGEAGSAVLAVRLGALPAVDVNFNAQSIDLDNYLAADVVRPSAISALVPFLQSDNSFEKRLNFQSAKLHLNHVEAQNVAFDFASSVSGFEVKKFDVGSIEGAHVQGQGLVLVGPDGPSGDLKLSVAAEDPRGFLRMLGFGAANGVDASWAKVLGATDLRGSVAIKPAADEPKVTFEVAGQSGPLQISVSGDVKDVAKGLEGTIGLSTEVNSNNSADLMQLFGFDSRVPGEAGRIDLTALGSNAAGFKAAVNANLFGVQIDYDGTYKPDVALPKFDGKFSVMAEDGDRLGQAMGLPLQHALAGALKVKATIASQDRGLTTSQMTAEVAGQYITGQMKLEADGKISADLVVPSLHLKNILALSFLKWTGESSYLDHVFADDAVLTKSGEIWLRPNILQTGLGVDLKEAVVGLAFDEKERSVTIASRDGDGEPFKLDVSLKQKGSSFALSGSSHFAVDLGNKFKLKTGEAIAKGVLIVDGQASSEGRSPQAVVASLNGSGSYVFHDAELALISPQSFFDQLKSIKDAVALQKAFDSLLQGPGMMLSAEKHDIGFANGAIIVDSLVVATVDADVKVAPGFDMATGDVLADVTITPKAETSLPAMRITYSGQPDALEQRNDTSALSAKLGYAIVAKDLAELDRVQKEQVKLVAEEAAQRKRDEEKFAAYQAQRGELRLRQRELKVHAAQRLIDAAAQKAELDKIMAAGAAINKIEIAKFKRGLTLH